MICINGHIIEQKKFPDRSLLMKIGDFDIDKNDILIHWLYENDAELFSLICIKDYFDATYINPQISLWMPYIPHARMDRVKDRHDVFTLKSFCKTINSLNFKNVIVRDAHSNVSLALLENVVQERIDGYIESAFEQSAATVAFFPDEGAMKRYSDLIKRPYAFGIKNRDWETGEIKGLTLINEDVVKGKDVLIIDDICSKGGTFYHSAKALKAAGANKIYLYVSHLEETIFHGDLFTAELVEKIYTTNSIFPKDKQGSLITIVEP